MYSSVDNISTRFSVKVYTWKDFQDKTTNSNGQGFLEKPPKFTEFSINPQTEKAQEDCQKKFDQYLKSSCRTQQSPSRRQSLDRHSTLESDWQADYKKRIIFLQADAKMREVNFSNLQSQKESLVASNEYLKESLSQAHKKHIKLLNESSLKDSQLNCHKAQIKALKTQNEKCKKAYDDLLAITKKQKIDSSAYDKYKQEKNYQQNIQRKKRLAQVEKQNHQQARKLSLSVKLQKQSTEKVSLLRKQILEQRNKIQIKQIQILQLKNQLSQLKSQVKKSNQKLEQTQQSLEKCQQQLNTSIVENIDQAISSQSNKVDAQKLEIVQEQSQRIRHLQCQVQNFQATNEALIRQNVNLKIELGKVEVKQQQRQVRSISGLWSPNRRPSLQRQIALKEEEKLNKTILDNHYQGQKYKEKSNILSIELQNLKEDYDILRNQKRSMQQSLLNCKASIGSIQKRHACEVQNMQSNLRLIQRKVQELEKQSNKKSKELREKDALINKLAVVRKTKP